MKDFDSMTASIFGNYNDYRKKVHNIRFYEGIVITIMIITTLLFVNLYYINSFRMWFSYYSLLDNSKYISGSKRFIIILILLYHEYNIILNNYIKVYLECMLVDQHQ